jgi:GT2 family glycosyltransferase
VTARSTGRVVVLHRTVPASGAPDPRDRQVLRRIVHLAAAARTECVLVAAEPQLGSAVRPELERAYVRVVEAAGCVVDALRTECQDAAVVVATDLHLARVASRALPDVPLVADLDAVPSRQLASTTIHVDAAEVEGFEAEVRRARELDASVLGRAALVVCSDDGVAAQVRALDGEVPSLVVPPAVPLDRAPLGLGARSGTLFVGRFASEPGSPDEGALTALLDAGFGSVDVAGIDVSPLRRRMRHELAAVHGPDDWWRAQRRARVAVIGRAGGPLAAELAGATTPVVALEDPDAAERLALLLRDDAMWRVAGVSQAATARTLHDPVRRGHEFAEALAALGAPVDPERVPPPSGAADTFRRRSVAGTLAAVTEVHECLRAEAQPTPLIPWEHALYTNLDLPYDVAYRRWLDVHHDVAARRAVLDARTSRLENRPLISVVMPVHQTDPVMLREAVDSVRAQIYPRWQLCIADDGTTRADTRAILDELADGGAERITLVRLDEAAGIVAATNSAIGVATGAYVAFLDHDDVLTPDALASVARMLDADPSLDVIYTDEDKLDAQGRRTEPFAKPDWSPDFLLSCNYVTHLLVVRRSLLVELGGLRSGFDGAQDYDLLLRLAERTDRIGHLAKPVYSWRMSPTSTAADIGAKPEAHAASRRALAEALERRGIDAVVERGFDPTWHRVRRRIAHRPVVTVVIPTRDRVDLLAPCINLVRRTVRHEPLELVVVDNESRDPETLRYLERFDGRVLRYPHRFNYARQMNLAARAANGEVLLLLNNDARPVDDEWFDAMLEHALRPEVGAVGARLRFPSGEPQHEGVVLNAAGVALNLDSGPWAVLGENIRDTSAVTAACMMIRTSVWHEVGGMDERLRVAYNDIDLCLRVGERGWRIVYTPYAQLHHAESSSRGSLHPEVDEAFYQRRWGAPRSTADPFFTTAVELLAPFSPRL